MTAGSIGRNRMNTIYLCGGINGLSDEQCTSWRQLAKDSLKGFNFLDPMRRDYRGREHECVDEIIGGDKVDIINSDIVLVNATRPSWGTAMEILYAYQHQKVIVAVTGDSIVSPWVVGHCSHSFKTWGQACDCIKELAA
jgi:hypothetical protein